MHSATVNLTPLLDVLFIILFIMVGQQSEKAKDNIEKLQHKKKTLEKNLENNISNIDLLRKEISILKKLKSDLQKKINVLQEQWKKEKQEWQQQLEKIESKLKAKIANLQRINQELIKRTAQTKILKDKNNALEKEKQLFAQQKEKLNAKINQLQKAKEKILQESTKQKDSMIVAQKKIKELSKLIKTLSKRKLTKKELQASLKKINQEKLALQNQLAQLKQQIEKLQLENKRLRKQLAQFRTKEKQQKFQLTKAQQEKENIKKKLKKAQKTIIALQKKISTMLAKTNQLQTSTKTWEKKYTQLNHQHEQLKHQYAERGKKLDYEEQIWSHQLKKSDADYKKMYERYQEVADTLKDPDKLVDIFIRQAIEMAKSGGGQFYKTVLKSRILSDSFHVYEIVLKRGYVFSIGKSGEKEKRKRVCQTSQEFSKFFDEIVPSTVMVRSSQNIFLIIGKPGASMKQKRIAEKKLREIKVCYGSFYEPYELNSNN